MSLQIEHLCTPFLSMTPEEQMDLIHRVREKRFTIKDSVVKRRAAKVERKSSTKRVDKLKDLLAAMPSNEREAFLEKLKENL